MSDPTLEHPVIGFRSWHMSKDNSGAMCSRFVNNSEWAKGVNKAVCAYPDRHVDDAGKLDRTCAQVPSVKCHCGFQCHHTFDQNLTYFVNNSSDLNSRNELVYGVIKGWGRTMVHPDGWRSEFAEIVAILPSPNTAGAKAAAQYYGVPLLHAKTMEDLELTVSEYGKRVPVENRPNPLDTPVANAVINAKNSPETIAAALTLGVMVLIRKLTK